jgi:GntR family transcriptional regulator
MHLDETKSKPLYSQVEQTLRNKIETHQWQAGFQLPSERELCASYHVSRITVRRAINELSRQNLVQSIPGKGTFVVVSRMREPLRPLSSFSEDMRKRGLMPHSRILQAEILPADESTAHALGIPVGSEVVHLKRLRMVSPEELAVAIQTAVIPHSRCPNVLRFNLQKRSLYEVFRDEYHLELGSGETIVSARLATQEESKPLGIKLPAAVLVSDQVTYLANGDVIEMVNSVFRSDIYQLTVFN